MRKKSLNLSFGTKLENIPCVVIYFNRPPRNSNCSLTQTEPSDLLELARVKLYRCDNVINKHTLPLLANEIYVVPFPIVTVPFIFVTLQFVSTFTHIP